MNYCKPARGLAAIFFIGSMLVAMTSEAKRLESGISIDIRGEGRPILMIPGLNSAAATWDSSCEPLQAAGFACHLVQFPGFAGSEPVKAGGFTDAMAEGLLAYVAQAKLENPVVMGHSLGGFVAMKMAIKADPNTLGPLVIVDSLPFLPGAYNDQLTAETAKPMAEIMRQNMLNPDPNVREQQTRLAVSSMTRSPDKIETLVKWGMASDLHTSAQAMYELMTEDLRPHLGKIQQPVLVLGSWAAYANYGATMDSVKSRFEHQYANLEQAEISMSASGYHFLMWDDPEWFLSEIRNFLQK